MVNCSDSEELNTTYRIAMLRHGRFIDSLNGLAVTAKDDEEHKRLEDEMNEAERVMMRHQTEHGCRG